jgi:hypothetical protein
VDIEAQSKTFSSFGGVGRQQLAYTAGAEPIQLQIGEVTGRFFEALGVQPERGRYISASDDKVGGPYGLSNSTKMSRSLARQFR